MFLQLSWLILSFYHLLSCWSGKEGTSSEFTTNPGIYVDTYTYGSTTKNLFFLSPSTHSKVSIPFLYPCSFFYYSLVSPSLRATCLVSSSYTGRADPIASNSSLFFLRRNTNSQFQASSNFFGFKDPFLVFFQFFLSLVPGLYSCNLATEKKGRIESNRC